MQTLWKQSRFSESLRGIRRPDETVASDPEECIDLLAAQWRQVFAAKRINAERAKTFVERHGRPLPAFCWKLPFEGFSSMLDACMDSAPGPDGIPYSAWARAPRPIRVALYAAFDAFLHGQSLPDDFNHAFLALLAKGEHPEDQVFVARAPEETRPLSLSNTDAKLFAMAIKTAASKRVESWASGTQRGFLTGRQMLDNALEVETTGMVASMNVDNRPAMLFFDFGAASPSVAHLFI